MARRALTVATVAVAIVAMYLAWPAPLGGRTSYVITSGVSMEPRFHSGDLAILRRADQYRVGEVVGYHSRSLRVTVLHRIVEHPGDRFIFQGDNNTWRDADQPTKADIIGRLAVRIPRGGVALRFASQPAVLLLAGGLVTVAGTSPRRRRARRRRSEAAPGTPDPRQWLGGHLPRSLGQVPQGASSAAAAAGVLLLTVTVLAWAVPARVEGRQVLPIEQHATISYQARVTPDAVYPSGTLHFPDPVFLRLVPALDVVVRYDGGQVLGSRVDGLGGSHTVFADLRSVNGWQRRFALQPETPFTGQTFQTTVRLPLSDVSRVIEEVQRLTASPNGAYSLTVTTQVMLTGTLDGAAVTRDFRPSVAFDLDTSQLRLSEAPADGATSILRSQTGSLPVAGSTARLLPFPPHPPLSTVRVASAVLTVAALVVAALLAGQQPPRRPPTQILDIPRRYRRRMVTTRAATIPADRTVLAVDSIATLHRIAERYERFIMYDISPVPATEAAPGASGAGAPRRVGAAPARWDKHTFLVDDDTALYLFVTHIPAPRNEPEPPRGRRHPYVPGPRHAS